MKTLCLVLLIFFFITPQVTPQVTPQDRMRITLYSYHYDLVKMQKQAFEKLKPKKETPYLVITGSSDFTDTLSRVELEKTDWIENKGQVIYAVKRTGDTIWFRITRTFAITQIATHGLPVKLSISGYQELRKDFQKINF